MLGMHEKRARLWSGRVLADVGVPVLSGMGRVGRPRCEESRLVARAGKPPLREAGNFHT